MDKQKERLNARTRLAIGALAVHIVVEECAVGFDPECERRVHAKLKEFYEQFWDAAYAAGVEDAAKSACSMCEEGDFPVFWDERKRHWAHRDTCTQVTVSCGANLIRKDAASRKHEVK